MITGAGAQGRDGGLNLQTATAMWGTPTARDWKDGDTSQMNVPENGLLGRMASNWPTPDASVMNDGEGPETFFARQAKVKAKKINGNGMGLPLTMAAQIWSTPRATDGEKGGPNQAFSDGRPALTAQAQQWFTPTVPNGGRTLSEDCTPTGMTVDGVKRQVGLENQARRVSPSLRSILPDHPISTVGEESSHIRRTLNPLFVEWLMGWPPGWTSLALTPPASNGFACSETALSGFKQRMRSALFQLGLPEEVPVQQDLFA